MRKIKKVLVANRGEIALRIIRACRELGIESVAVYSDVDRLSLHVLSADYAFSLGAAPSVESYLNIEKIVEVALQAKVDAIHPGYGFLAENADFARAVEDAGIIFIGPSARTIELMGSKIASRQIMERVGVPVVPGTIDPISSIEEARKVAAKIGYPVLIKASAGGGGKGMRKVADEAELESAFRTASSEAQASFGDSTVYIEKYIENPRHIEVQIIGDTYGNVIHLFERECSIQRRHQKVIEEAPSPSINDTQRKALFEAAVKAALAVDYYNAGTVEFIFDKEGNFYFLEMNTRLQVEHPVTEFVTGVDIVKEQILISEGARLRRDLKNVSCWGHAIEFRLYAEDPKRNFAPTPGKISYLQWPNGGFVRIDEGVYEGWEVPIYYDPLIAKMIVWGRDRKEAIDRSLRALFDTRIEGITTTLDLFRAILRDQDFIEGNFDVSYLDKRLNDLIKDEAQELLPVLASAILESYREKLTVQDNDMWKKVARLESVGGCV